MTLHIQHCTKNDFDKDIELLPSTRVFYNDYPYRVDIKGPGHPHKDFDPHFHYEITDFLRTSNMFFCRQNLNVAGRRIYFGLYDDFLWFVNWMSDYIRTIHAPVSEQHILDLHTPGLILRDKLWHSQFDQRLEFSKSYVRLGSQSKEYSTKALMEFVKTNFEDYRWATTKWDWHYNYLYCNSAEFTDLEGFINLSFKKLIRRTDKLKLFNEL
tara:strand:+ start:232 stop:867 length:636 start_codon:yes stop_codon:yes gene_type:complete